jgi:hypothetical protein
MNTDNANLQPLRAGPFLIGCVDDVNGGGAVEVPELVVTRAEALELAKYWEDIFLSRSFVAFKTRQFGSTDLRRLPFAERRVKRIIKVVGSDAHKAVHEVMFKFAKEIGVREWERFCEYLGPGHLHAEPPSTNDVLALIAEEAAWRKGERKPAKKAKVPKTAPRGRKATGKPNAAK